ncbi:CcmD family protein [candidate division GN15 bacterium]|nr:CcmD family protein [candidate division GN15 bacterium]
MDGNYVALIVTLVVWVGLFLFLRGLHKRVRKLEERSR